MSRKLFFLAAIFGSFLFLGEVWAADCPKGLINDPAPGECGLYVDKNKDGFCDRSQELAQATKTVPLKKSPPILVSPQVEEQSLPNQEEAIESPIPEEIVPVIEPALIEKNDLPRESRYHFWPITLATFFFYGLSWVLVKIGWLNCLANRRFWNWLLLLFFLPTVVSSLVLLGRLEFGWQWGTSFDWSFWHVELGYLLILVSLFHLSWHGRYYRCVWQGKRKKRDCLRKEVSLAEKC